MQDFINIVMLVCAAGASMGLGVYLAYGLFKAGFALMRWHTQQNAPAPAVSGQVKAAAQVARVS
jgi:hypothetical protein